MAFINTIQAILLLSMMQYLTDGKPATSVFNKNPKSLTPEPLLNLKAAVHFLTQYGYLTKAANNTFDSKLKNKMIEAALKDYQAFFKLPITGKLDQITSDQMRKPRCGLPDKPINQNAFSNFKLKAYLTARGRKKKELLDKNGYSHGTRKFTWHVDLKHRSRYLRFMAEYLLDYGINLWATVANVRFERVAGDKPADIKMSFHRGDHGHGVPFDGPLNALAHASAELKEIHFDDDERWEYYQRNRVHYFRPGRKPDLVQCAAHEIGHIFGFSHSQNVNSIMYPHISAGVRGAEYALDGEDIARIQKVFGTCWADRFDAIFSNLRGDGRTYISVGPYIYLVDNSKVSVDSVAWPQEIHSFFGSGFVLYDDVFHGENDRLYYLWNKWYHYDISSTQLSPNRAEILKTTTNPGWAGLAFDNIDAAFKHLDGFVYIFKGDYVWKWDFNAASPTPGHIPPGKVDPAYPKLISKVFPGVPNDIDTAFRWNYDGNVYFFKGRYFYIWDPKAGRANGIYATDQWKNVCDVLKCSYGKKCRSWDINTKNCGSLCALS